jgi:peptidyl-prolyl cis-trans isomerase C
VKKLSAILSLALAASAAMAQQSAPATPAPATPAPQAATQQPKADPVIITTATMQVHQSEFEGAIKTLPAEYQGYANGPGRKQFADDYVRMKLLAAEAAKNGLQNDPDVQSQLALMRENLLANAQLNRLEKSAALSDADIQKAYDEHKSDYEQAKARHILIAFKGSQATQPGKKELTDAEAKAKAEEIRKKLVAGADFAELAKKESDDPSSAARGGDLGTFGRGQMVPEFEKAVFEGKLGDVSPIVRTDFGYHIIQVQERSTAPLAQVKPALEKELKQKKVQEQLDALKAAAQPVYDTTYFAPPPPPPAAMAPAPATPATDKTAPASSEASKNKKTTATKPPTKKQ